MEAKTFLGPGPHQTKIGSTSGRRTPVSHLVKTAPSLWSALGMQDGEGRRLSDDAVVDTSRDGSRVAAMAQNRGLTEPVQKNATESRGTVDEQVVWTVVYQKPWMVELSEAVYGGC